MLRSVLRRGWMSGGARRFSSEVTQTPKVDPGDLALATEAARQGFQKRPDEHPIDWGSAMQMIHEVESRFPLEKPSEEERAEVVADTVTFNLAKLINGSETLQGLVEMGVGIWNWEKEGFLDMAITLDLERDVVPRFRFLTDLGLEPGDAAAIMTTNGHLMQTDVAALEARVAYMTDMGFKEKEIVSILRDNHYWLNNEAQRLDGRLGYIQKQFGLRDDEVRAVAVRCPRLITWGGIPSQLHLNKLTLKDFAGLTPDELKRLLVTCPEALMEKHQERMRVVWGHLLDEVGYTKELVLRFPRVLTVQMAKVRYRLGFLRFVGRDQFDPAKPNYVSPEVLMLSEDSAFCKKAGKVPEKIFEKYLKTL